MNNLGKLTVTIAIPCLNEELHIDNVLRGFLGSSYPQIIEILVVDGGSKDATRNKAIEWGRRDLRVRLLHNPHRYQSHALNIALEAARGDVFLRADAHCVYAEDYVERCVEALIESGAQNVGGAQRFIAESRIQFAVALLVTSFIGSGGARYRRAGYSGYAETVFLGCYWRNSLISVGGYDISALINEDFDLNARIARGPYLLGNVTNQDAELNLRIMRGDRAGIYVSERIRVWYWPRSSVCAIAVQYFKYGRGRALTSLRHRVFWARGNLPFLIATSWLLGVFVETAFFGSMVVCILVAILALAVMLGEAIRIVMKIDARVIGEVWRGKGSPPRPGSWLACSILILSLVMNLSHVSGFAYQIGRVLSRLPWSKCRSGFDLRW